MFGRNESSNIWRTFLEIRLTLSSAWEQARTHDPPWFIPLKGCLFTEIHNLGLRSLLLYICFLGGPDWRKHALSIQGMITSWWSSQITQGHIRPLLTSHLPTAHCQKQITWLSPISTECTLHPQWKDTAILHSEGHGCTITGKWRIGTNNPSYDTSQSFSKLQVCIL